MTRAEAERQVIEAARALMALFGYRAKDNLANALAQLDALPADPAPAALSLSAKHEIGMAAAAAILPSMRSTPATPAVSASAKQRATDAYLEYTAWTPEHRATSPGYPRPNFIVRPRFIALVSAAIEQAERDARARAIYDCIRFIEGVLFDGQDGWRHKKRGTTYKIIGEAQTQVVGEPILEGSVVVVYRFDDDGSLWIRPKSEFYDGRFERLPAPPTSREGE